MRAELVRLKKQHEAEITKLTHSSQMSLTQAKMQQSSASTAILVEQKKTSKKLNKLLADLEQANEEITEKSEQNEELEKEIAKLRNLLERAEEKVAHQQALIASNTAGNAEDSRVKQELFRRLQAEEEKVGHLEAELANALEQVKTLRARFSNDYSVLECEYQKLKEELAVKETPKKKASGSRDMVGSRNVGASRTTIIDSHATVTKSQTVHRPRATSSKRFRPDDTSAERLYYQDGWDSCNHVSKYSSPDSFLPQYHERIRKIQ